MGLIKKKPNTPKTNQKNKRSRKTLVVALLVSGILLFSGIVVFYAADQPTVLDRAGSPDQSTKESADPEDEKSETDTTPPVGLSNNPRLDTKQDIPKSSQTSIQIESISQQNQTIHASATIDGTTSEGTCVFTFSTEGDRPVIRQVVSSNRICETKIPEAEFAKIGAWNLNITFYVDNSRSEVNQNVTIH